MIIGLIFALTKAGEGRTKAEKELREINKKLEQLQKDNQKLKEEKKNNEGKTVETTAKQPIRPTAVQRIRPSIFSGCEAYRPLVSQYSWPIDTVLQIMYAESGCNPDAISSTNDHGLMQLHGIRIYDPAQNIAYAYNEKYLKGGFRHWSVCTKGIVDCW